MLITTLMDIEPKFTYKLVLSYKGTYYSGWQNQTQNARTIQNHVEGVLKKIARYQKCQVIGASRTDKGVHASGQALKVILPREIAPEILTRGMNSMLPSDIKVVSSEFAHEKLNVYRDSKYKEYHYYFSMSKNENATLSDTVYFYPEKLNIEVMKKACDLLIGSHNFISFCTPGPKPPTPIRNIMKCSIEKTSFLTLEDDIYYLKIQGNGFLRYMVRFLMGALWDIGIGKLSLDDLTLSLKSDEAHGVRTKAPCQGLHLIHIEY